MRTGDRNPSLDQFREAIAVLQSSGDIAGYLATRVERVWSWRHPLGLRDCVFLLVTWNDGRREWIQDDYPWHLVEDLLRGVFIWEPDQDEAVEFSVHWLDGAQRDSAWAHYATDWWSGNESSDW